MQAIVTNARRGRALSTLNRRKPRPAGLLLIAGLSVFWGGVAGLIVFFLS